MDEIKKYRQEMAYNLPYANQEQKQKSFAIKSGLLFWLSLAFFIAVCLVGGVSAGGFI